MERLTAFEFITPTDRPQLVRLKRQETVLAEFGVVRWLGWVPAIGGLGFAAQKDLVIEGEGIGRPYWNDEPVPWAEGFDPVAEQRRIETIRVAAQREANRILLSH